MVRSFRRRRKVAVLLVAAKKRTARRAYRLRQIRKVRGEPWLISTDHRSPVQNDRVLQSDLANAWGAMIEITRRGQWYRGLPLSGQSERKKRPNGTCKWSTLVGETRSIVTGQLNWFVSIDDFVRRQQSGHCCSNSRQTKLICKSISIHATEGGITRTHFAKVTLVHWSPWTDRSWGIACKRARRQPKCTTPVGQKEYNCQYLAHFFRVFLVRALTFSLELHASLKMPYLGFFNCSKKGITQNQFSPIHTAP